MRVKNFLFHRVGEVDDALWPPMRPELFKRIVHKLARKYEVVCLEDFLSRPEHFENVRKPLATILFDDGYKDNASIAAPILTRAGCPASFYVVTGCIDQKLPTWTYVVDYMIQQMRQPKIKLDVALVPPELRELEMSDPLVRKIKPWMKQISNKERLAILHELQQQLDVAIPSDLMMNWDEVRRLRDYGFAIGSHSHSHPLLAKLESEEEIRMELQTSYDRIKTELGQSPMTISYPIGSYDERVIRIAKATGYRIGLAVEQRFYETTSDDRMAIPRVELYEEPWWKTASRINGIFNRVKRWVN